MAIGGLPLLWFALFRPEDMITWDRHGLDGLPAKLPAPVAARRDVPARLATALALLNRAAPKAKNWDVHLRLLGEAIDALDRKWKYLTWEWEEIIALDPKGVLSSANWMLRFFGGHRVQKTYQSICEISGLTLNRPLRDPVASTNEPSSEKDEKILACLLGNGWKRSVPWWPKLKPAKATSPGLSGLISKRDGEGMKRALEAGQKIPDSAVAKAARESLETLEFLLALGGDPNSGRRTPGLGPPLLEAFMSGEDVSAKVRVLLDAGAKPTFGHWEHDRYIVVCCCANGMEFAPRILKGATKKSLRQFLAWVPSDNFREFVADDHVTWADKFVAMAKRELAKRS